MFDENRFFKALWRLNAIVIAAVAILAGLLGVYALYSILRQETRMRNVSDLVIVNPEQSVQEELILGFPQAVSGTKVVRVPLFREQKTNVSYYSKTSGSNRVNELVVDSFSGKSEWLFQDAARLILDSTEVLAELKSDSPRVLAIVYTLVEGDSDGNGTLTSADHINIGYSNPESATFVPLMQNVEKLYAVQQVADDRLMVIYAKGGESRLMTYSLPAFAVLTDSPLPKPEPTGSNATPAQ